MKRLLSSLLIVLILLNVLGYYGLFLGLLHKNHLEMTEKIDLQDYANSETFTLKIPVTIPYGPVSRASERVNGQFEHQGEFFRLVEQKIFKDTVYVVCVRDQQSKEIHEALAGYVKTFTDQSSEDHSTSKIFSEFSKDYIAPVFSLGHLSLGWGEVAVQNPQVKNLQNAFVSSILLPPRLLEA